MLITAVRSRAVSLPLQPVPYSVERAATKREWGKTRLTPHRPKPSLQYVIVEIDTDDGITGVGEACTDIGFFGEPVEEVQIAIDLYLGPKLLGKDPFDREQLLFDIDFPGNSCAKSGIDLALHDLLGKALGVPVCNLIGGSAGRQVLAVMEVAPGTADGMARQCAEWVEQGVRGFKAKLGAIPEDDVERLAAIRAAVGPKIMLRADANQGYTPKEAIRLCRMCERRDLRPQPLKPSTLPATAIRSALPRRGHHLAPQPIQGATRRPPSRTDHQQPRRPPHRPMDRGHLSLKRSRRGSGNEVRQGICAFPWLYANKMDRLANKV